MICRKKDNRRGLDLDVALISKPEWPQIYSVSFKCLTKPLVLISKGIQNMTHRRTPKSFCTLR